MQQPTNEEQKQQEPPKQIELNEFHATAMNASIEQLNAFSALAQARAKAHEDAARLHAEAAQRERENFGRVLAMHQTHVAALVKAAGGKFEDYRQHGVFPDGDKWYLRPAPQDGIGQPRQ
ncbi:MAG: hypothetical protein LAQ30_04340 [Acidobacteriia bacterium]|nr:hypothetical protein [Terriglobia bacterium]